MTLKLKALIAFISVVFSPAVSNLHPPPKIINTSNANVAQHSPASEVSLKKARHSLILKKIPNKYFSLVAKYSAHYHIPLSLSLSIMAVENGLQAGGTMRGAAQRVSRSGAIGPMQLLPATARSMGVYDPWNAEQNIKAGIKYLHYLRQQLGDQEKLIIVAYNRGPIGALNMNRWDINHSYYLRTVQHLNHKLSFLNEEL